MNGIKIVLSSALLSLFAFGCCCSEKTGNAAKADDAKVSAVKAEDAKKMVKSAGTPDGDVVYVVTAWEAEAVCPCPKKPPCKTAQCWEAADGNTYCAKPLRDASEEDKAKKTECYKTSDGKLKAVDNAETAGKDGKATEWCVKQVTKCPKDGDTAKCNVEHVKMKDGSKGCSKADVKCAKKRAEAATSEAAAPEMEDDVEEDDFFMVVTD